MKNTLIRSHFAYEIPPNKNRFVYFLLNFLIPGIGEFYLGGAFKKRGLSALTAILLCFPLIFAYGLGLFLIALIWLGSFITTIVSIMMSPKKVSSSPFDNPQ